MAELYVGIDPDVDKSGFALWDRHTLKELSCFPLWEVFDYITTLSGTYSLMVRIEAGWLAKGMNWHKRGGLGAANAVGRNHEIGRQIEKYCIDHGISYQLVLPQGYSSWDHQRFCTYTQWNVKARTNSEMRVAGLMVYGCV